MELDILSIFLGMIALIIPFIIFFLKKATNIAISVILSLSMCSCAMITQLFALKQCAYIGDFSAIEDTIHARCLAAILLTALVCISNIIVIRQKAGNH